ncbi:hypothetical protein ACIPXV_27090 [Streptomyces libani]|uniref:hypothetical protein n=1 Tax=Streptomyces TaxID=1883 RepID=UPI00140E9B13|nr:hypothetical protein [Streptomyces sp. ID38640]QIK04759.1 hypothetical protein G7Z12_00370 [Streptomyces sp. ID38640]
MGEQMKPEMESSQTRVDPAFDSTQQCESGSAPGTEHTRSFFRTLVAALAVIGSIGAAIGYGLPIGIALWNRETWIVDLYSDHFAAVVGLPGCALLAFILVMLLEARFEKIEMEFFGVVRFHGASGPIVLWALCFFLMACAVAMLW